MPSFHWGGESELGNVQAQPLIFSLVAMRPAFLGIGVLAALSALLLWVWICQEEGTQRKKKRSRGKKEKEQEAAARVHEPTEKPSDVLVLVEHECRAEDAWKVWYDLMPNTKGMTDKDFAESIKELGTFGTIADFWNDFGEVMQEKLPMRSNIRVFQNGVKPQWEDPLNVNGGKWIIVVSKNKSIGAFNEVLAGAVAGSFSCEISGVVLSKKPREDLVSVWTPSGVEPQILERVRDELAALVSKHLSITPQITFMYHDKKNNSQTKIKGINIGCIRHQEHDDVNSPIDHQNSGKRGNNNNRKQDNGNKGKKHKNQKVH